MRSFQGIGPHAWLSPDSSTLAERLLSSPHQKHSMRTRRLFRPLIGLCWLAVVSSAFPVRSQSTNVWTNSASGLWHDAANWSLGVAPLFTNSIVAITNFSSKTVTADASTPATNLYLRNLTLGALQNRQNTLVLTNLVAPMEVTRGFTLNSGASLQIHNSRLSVDGTLGGEMTLTAANAVLHSGSVTLTNNALLKVGNGTGLASFAVSNGALRVGSDLRVGALNRSFGRLTLAAGLVNVGGEFTVADATGSTGAVVVLNGVLQALNTNVNARIGQRGVGSLVLSNGLAQFDDVSVGRQEAARGSLFITGGNFMCGTLSIGRFSNAVGLATMTGGTLNVADGSLYVGREGIGSLTNAGGLITASRLVVSGATNSASGTARFSGGAAMFTAGLSLGSLVSTGQIVVDGGTLVCTNATGTSTGLVSSGTFTLSSGRACFDTLLLTNATAQFQFLGGTLCVSNLAVSNGAPFVVGDGVNPATFELIGAATFAHGIIISPNATLSGCGTLLGGITVLPGGANTFSNCPPATGTTITLTAIAPVPDGVRFSFPAEAGVNYTVEFKNSLSAPAWQTGQSFAGFGGLAHVTNAPGPGVSRFYRVRKP